MPPTLAATGSCTHLSRPVMRSLIALSLIFGASVVAAQTFTFKFAPPPDAFREHAKVTKVHEIGAVKTTTVMATSTIQRFTKSGENYILHHTTEAATFSLNGKETENPIFTALRGAQLKQTINAKGVMTSVAGYDVLIKKIIAAMPAESRAMLSAKVHEKGRESTDIAEWERKVGQFVGKTMKIGDKTESESERVTSEGRVLLVRNVTAMDSLVPCGKKRCVKIKFTNSSKPTAFDPQTGSAEDSLTIQMTGNGHRLIDPATMLIHGETMYETVNSTIHFGGTVVKVAEQVNWDYTYDYNRK